MRLTPMFSRLLALASLLFAAAGAQSAAQPGTDFDYLPNVMPTESPAKVEVIEFFWYGCPHCYHLEPKVEAWAKTLPKDVSFRREHVMWDGRSDMAGHAKLFVALKSMGLVDATMARVFDAVHKAGVELRDEKTLYDWIAKQGIDHAKFEAAFKSFGAQAQFNRATQLTRDYRIDGVPTFIVNGKYKTSPGKVGNEDKFFAVVNELIAKERAALKPAKPAVTPKPAEKKS